MAFSDSKPHYALLDALRGVAALLVVWYHVFEGYQFAGNKPVIDFVNHGYLAVDFFFILSGFVIGYAYDDRWGKSLSMKAFFKRRLIRLHPMVVMGAFIGMVSFVLLSDMERWDGTHSTFFLTFIAFVCSCLMLPALPGMARDVRGNGEMFPLNGPSWSLFFEYIGNILYAFFLRRLPTRALAWLTALLACALTWFAVTNQSGYGSIGVGWTIDATNVLGGTLRMLCPFTVGMLMSRIFKPMKRVRGAFWICALMLLALFHVPYISDSWAFSLNNSQTSGGDGDFTLCINGVFEAVSILLVFPAIVWMAASGTTTDSMSARLCRFLGDISFPLYVVHYPLMYAFYRYLIKTQTYSFADTWLLALAVMGASIGLAWLCFKCYDEPVRKWLKRFYF